MLPAPRPARTAAAHKIAFLLAAAARGGGSPAALLHRYGLDPTIVSRVDARVPIETVCRMWEELPGLLGDPDLPLRVVDAAAEADPPLPVLLFLSAPTLGEALRRMIRFERLGFDVADAPVSRLRVDGDQAILDLDLGRCARLPPAGAVAQTLAAVVRLARTGTGAPVTPLRATLRWPAPPRRDRWVEVFGPSVVFDAAADELAWDARDLARPHPAASRTLSWLAVRQAEALSSALPSGDDGLEDVRRAVRRRLPDGPPALRPVARELAASERTLQRRLRAAGTSWRALLDDERRGAAVRALSDPRASVLEVALASGFQDPSAFGRAFRRWTGDTPRAWRLARRAGSVAPAAGPEGQRPGQDGPGAEP